jgi:hypothetical protein
MSEQHSPVDYEGGTYLKPILISLSFYLLEPSTQLCMAEIARGDTLRRPISTLKDAFQGISCLITRWAALIEGGGKRAKL